MSIQSYFEDRTEPMGFRLPRGVKPRPYIKHQTSEHRGYLIKAHGKENNILKEGSAKIELINLNDEDDYQVVYLQSVDWPRVQREVITLKNTIDKELKNV